LKHPIIITRNGEVTNRKSKGPAGCMTFSCPPNFSKMPLTHKCSIREAIAAYQEEEKQKQLIFNLANGKDENGLIIWAKGSSFKNIK